MKKFLVIAGLFLCTQAAHAGVFVEPFIGFLSGDLSQTTTAGSTATATNNGFNYGARLGYYFGSTFWLAGEFTGGTGKSKDSATQNDYTKAATGAVIGYDAGKYNFWFGYAFSDKITYKSSTMEIYTSGTNVKIGVGHEAAKNVSVDVEFIIPTFTKFGNGTTELNISDSFSKYSLTELVLSVSFPFGAGK